MWVYFGVGSGMGQVTVWWVAASWVVVVVVGGCCCDSGGCAVTELSFGLLSS